MNIYIAHCGLGASMRGESAEWLWRAFVVLDRVPTVYNHILQEVSAVIRVCIISSFIGKHNRYNIICLACVLLVSLSELMLMMSVSAQGDIFRTQDPVRASVRSRG